MTDAELIARLRYVYADADHGLAADRIEAMIAERDDLRTKLAVALEELAEIASGRFSGQLLMSMPPKDPAAAYARNAIHRLKGESHE